MTPDTVFIIGRTLDMIGKLMIAMTAIRVHHKVLSDHGFDKAVYKEIKYETWFGISGIILIVAAYFIEVYAIAYLGKQF